MLFVAVNHTCLETHFKCKKTNKCIDKKYVCDGTDNCEDKTDEEQAMCSEYLFALYHL